MLAIIDYGVGNLTSILNMHRRLGIQAMITGKPEEIEKADKLLIPGVGHFDKCMQNFNGSGLREIVEKRAMIEKVPLLGICVGAQMMMRQSEEGSERGLGWLNGDTVKFRLPAGSGLKVPHMGWSDVRWVRPLPLWADMPEEPRFYFAHSYHFQFDTDQYVAATVNYGYDFACGFNRDNIYGVQFHPEKSHRYGMKLLTNFASL
jgi:glutamine amidotransferase